jgi:hypothetical protein
MNGKNEKIGILTNKIIEIYHNLNYNCLCFIDMIHKNIENYLNETNHLQNLFNSLEEIYKNYQLKKKALTEIKEKYHTSGKNLEKLLIETFNQNENPSNQINNLLTQMAINLKKYKNSINDINECKNEYNKKLNELKEKCSKLEEISIFNFAKEEISKNLELNLKMISKTILDIKTINNIQNLNNDIYLFDNINIKKMKSLKNILLIHYPSKIDFSLITSEKEYKSFYKTIDYIKSKIDDKDLFKNYDEKKEKERIEKIKIIEYFFDNDAINFDADIKQQLINIMKDNSFHEQFILIMSQNRIKSERKKAWIEIMGECLNIIIEKSKEINCYDKIKNSIILTQTYYYYEAETKQKIYMFKLIKNHEFFKDIKFWQDFIDSIIDKEYKHFFKQNDINYTDSLDGLQINNNLKNKLSDLLFSQLLPYVKNMNDFEIDREDIIKIINIFMEKYKYLSKINYDSIIKLISNK